MVKKIAIAVWLLTATFLGILILNYTGNRKLINNFDQGNYQQNEMGFLGFTQPYINHFNKGNVLYKLSDFEKAKQEYQMALNLRPDEPYDCKIRVNYALSYVTPIDTSEIDEDNYEDVIEICEKAKEILAQKDCATENNDGHYYAAQKLYNEINAFEDELRNQFEEPEDTPTPTPTPTQDPNETQTPTPTPKPDADQTATPTPTPTPEGDTPTPTPQSDSQTPTPTPGGSQTPTPTPGGDQPTPTDTGTPTPSPGTNSGTPTPSPGGDNTGTPSPTPGGDSGTPSPTPGGDNTGTPSPTPGGEGTGTPTPTPGGNNGQNTATPTPTKTPEERVRDIQDRGNRERYGNSGNEGGGSWNHGNSASW